jgi:predicted amidohydrolase
MNPSLVRIAAVQMEPTLGDVAGNLEKIKQRLVEATGAGARLVVFPECALTGYCFSSREEAIEFAEPSPGKSLTALAIECALRKSYAVVGFLERDGNRLYNSCALVGSGGVVGTYRKVHLPYVGVDRFLDAGDRPFAVNDAGGLRIGMHICYDGSFSEPGRILSLLGADLLVLPTNWPQGMESGAEHLIPARALENTVYALAANRIGEERSYRFIGRSSIADPTGKILAFGSPDQEEILYADIDPSIARRKQLVRRPGEHEVNRIADRRPHFYGPLTEPNGRE